MKRLNNKGLTIMEVLLCFVLVSIITASMYTVISVFNEKRIQEKYKEEIFTYKNLLQSDIENDFINVGILSAKVEKTGPTNGSLTYDLTVTLTDGTKRKLIVQRVLNNTADASKGLKDYRGYFPTGETANVNDNFVIRYGPYTTGNDSEVMNYPLPDFGSTVEANGKTSKILSLHYVDINVDDGNRVLTIYIGFYHAELGTRYSLNIVAPINYNSISDKSIPLGLY